MSRGGGNMPAGRCKTFPRVVDLIKAEAKTKGVRGLAREVGISPAIITRYVNGKVGEPTTATLQKLANYFNVSVAWLRGEPESREITTQELQVLAEIREALGLGNRPMLSELPGIVRAMREELEGLRNG